jgi:hypothetical protein|tara:strand:- start:492 stop:620 length:129 start_codon:yes stop_codon:yes gene_type:complete
MHEHNFTLTELDDMLPWEREIYIALVEEHVNKENERRKKNNG